MYQELSFGLYFYFTSVESFSMYSTGVGDASGAHIVLVYH